MPAGAFSAARHLSFSDDWLVAGTGALDFKDLRDDMDFRPQAITVDSSSNSTENSDGYATVDGILFGENDSFRRQWKIPLRQPVGLAIRKVWAGAGTTARGISLLTEQ